MQGTKRVCFYCLHKLWLALAVSLVLLAVVISVLRYSLPHADAYKHQIEQMIAERYGAQVQIGELSAGWQKFGPALLLKNLRLNDNSDQLQLTIDETRIRIDFWRSLLNLRLTAQHFELSGLRYYIDSDSLLRGNANTDLQAAPILAALEQLFFKQLTYFSVVNSQLVLQSNDSPEVVIDISQLDWSNRTERHQGYGELSVAGVTANTVSFVLDLNGDTLAHSTGQLYLESDRLDVLPWFRQILPTSQKLDQANINFKAWGTVDKGTLQRIQVELAENSLSWRRNGEQHRLQLGAGQLLWQPTEQGWALYSGSLTLSDPQQEWPELMFQLQHQQQQWSGSISRFQLDAITPLANLLAEDIALLQQLVTYQPSGYLDQLNWQYNEGDWQGYGHFSQLATSAVNDIPGVSELQGDFVFDAEIAKLTLQGTDGNLQWDGFFNEPTAYTTLDAAAYFINRPQQQWQLLVPVLSLQNDDLRLDATMRFDGELEILARLQQLDAANASRYFPQRYMPATVSHYLSEAIVAGKLDDAAVLWHGAPADFPYAEHQGVFQVRAQLNEAQFRFSPDWPMLNQLNTELWFENAGMLISSQTGELAGIDVADSVTAAIPDLFHAETIDIHIGRQVDAAAVTALMQQSPLQDSLGKTLTHLGLSGQVDADVLLQIGLHQTGALASGKVRFEQLALQLQAPEMLLTDASGVLQFNNDNISSEGLALNWRGLPLTAAVQGALTDNGYQLDLQVQGEQDAKQLVQALYPAADALVDGRTNWQLQLALQLPAAGMQYQATLDSNLQQTRLALPLPYSKAADEQQHLRVTMRGNADVSQLALNLNNNLYFNAELAHSSQQLSRAHLVLGPDDEPIPDNDFTVSVNLSELDFLSWFELLQQQISTAPTSDKPLFPVLSHVRGKVAQLHMAPGITLNNTVFDAEQQAEQWTLQLNGKEVASHWLFSKDWQQQGITANLDYLQLPLAVAEQPTDNPAQQVVDTLAQTSQRWLLQLPPLTLNCADCSLGSYRFGQVAAKAHSDDKRWTLDQFQANYKKHKLTIEGYWQDDSAAGHSHFNGQLHSANLGAMLDEFQLTSAISGSAADINFDVDWPAAPNQFLLKELNGSVKFDLGDGSLTEISDQGSRLFSIFSLDSLLRKLRLDFRDVFAKGFFYNEMSGSLTLTRGVAQTSDATIDGVPGNLTIQGYADLGNDTLDYQMSFAPKVTSSLPIIIAWMVNPATGLAALALDEVFQSAEVISKINFTVTGSIDKPVVTEVNRHSKEVPVPVRIAKPEPTMTEEPVQQPVQPKAAEYHPHG